MFFHRRARGSVVEFALLVPLIALLLLSFLDLARVTLLQFRLERLSASLARELAASPLPSLEALQSLAQTRVAGVDDAIEAAVDLRAVESVSVTFPRDGRPIQLIDLLLSESVRSTFVPLRSPLRLRAHAREIRAR